MKYIIRIKHSLFVNINKNCITYKRDISLWLRSYIILSYSYLECLDPAQLFGIKATLENKTDWLYQSLQHPVVYTTVHDAESTTIEILKIITLTSPHKDLVRLDKNSGTSC